MPMGDEEPTKQILVERKTGRRVRRRPRTKWLAVAKK